MSPTRKLDLADGALGQRAVRGKVADEIVGILLSAVATGSIAAGGRLPSERELASHFGVSQPTIREAIRVLDHLGLIDVRHGSGTYVTGNSQRLVALCLQALLQLERVSIVDVLDIRGVLGRSSAVLAARNATDEDVERINALVDQLEHVDQIKDVDTVAETVLAFQAALSAAAKSPFLYALETFSIRLLMQFQVAAYRRRGIAFWRRWTLSVADDRRRLVERLASRDADAIVDAMDSYLEHKRALFASDRNLATLRLSDAESLRTLDEIQLALPSYPR